MANIRNQNSWVHAGNPDAATQKAKDLVRMAVVRSATLKPIRGNVIPVIKNALVIGGGIAGMNCALDLAGQGFDVFLVERASVLGGMSLNLHRTIEGAHIPAYVEKLVSEINGGKNIEVLLDSKIIGFEGYKGNFKTEVSDGSGCKPRVLSHGIVIVATGAREYRPTEYKYEDDARVITQLELGYKLEKGNVSELSDVVMIQCVGSRNDEFQLCSRVCCQSAVKNAIKIKELNLEINVFILYRDIRTYGFLED